MHICRHIASILLYDIYQSIYMVNKHPIPCGSISFVALVAAPLKSIWNSIGIAHTRHTCERMCVLLIKPENHTINTRTHTHTHNANLLGHHRWKSAPISLEKASSTTTQCYHRTYHTSNMFSVSPYEHPSLSQQQTAFHLWCFGSAKLITLIMVFEMCVYCLRHRFCRVECDAEIFWQFHLCSMTLAVIFSPQKAHPIR